VTQSWREDLASPAIEIAIICSQNRKMRVSVAEAKNTLPKLISFEEEC
jgi:hypothetical protein